MDEWRTDPTFAMCEALVDGAELSSFVGGPYEVRAVVAGIRPEARDGFLLDEVPWEQFPQGNRVREAVHLLHTGDSPRVAGTGVVGGTCANDMRAAAVLALLGDPDPAIRIHAAYALATATDSDRAVRAAFRARLAAEQDPIVRAALVLATAEATRAHPHPPTTTWMQERWRDRTQAPEVRLAAAIGWLCLTNEPAPDDLRATVDDLTTDERAHTMHDLPWMAFAGGSGETGLQRCVRKMLHPEQPEPVGYDDPWALRH
ncbi:hypothetical protein ACH4U5_40075 [Streptomyces sp. NPDC020858]|uniref:hypothetical protein n=1 Tax=Streptomyces sp. NPDC020858 TaxID=3365097 RepID=UPI0037B1561F